MKFINFLKLKTQYEKIKEDLSREENYLRMKRGQIIGAFSSSHSEEELLVKIEKLKKELKEIENTNLSF